MVVAQKFAVWCLLAAEIHFLVAAIETCQTAWFDEADVGVEGDSELLKDLRKTHESRICSAPVHMEARTVSGIESHRSGNTFHTHGASDGLLCLNSEQQQKRCEDYKVKFTCAGPFCSECQSRWFNHDDPAGTGDYELLSELLSRYPGEICPQPVAVQVQTAAGRPASNASQAFLNYDATYGFSCVNADQKSGFCDDYRIRFTCPAEFCEVSDECRTLWLSGDTPSGEGDVESLPRLMNTFPGHVCRDPIRIEAQTLSGVTAGQTGDTFMSYNVAFGFACINGEQEDNQCEDYQVILTCPSHFCQTCRTQWFNMDKPSQKGDYETVVRLQMLHPSQICSQPVAIEATTVSGNPAHKTGDVFQIYDAARGFACVNAEQPGGRQCQDYKVRFTCPPAFCSGSTELKP